MKFRGSLTALGVSLGLYGGFNAGAQVVVGQSPAAAVNTQLTGTDDRRGIGIAPQEGGPAIGPQFNQPALGQQGPAIQPTSGSNPTIAILPTGVQPGVSDQGVIMPAPGTIVVGPQDDITVSTPLNATVVGKTANGTLLLVPKSSIAIGNNGSGGTLQNGATVVGETANGTLLLVPNSSTAIGNNGSGGTLQNGANTGGHTANGTVLGAPNTAMGPQGFGTAIAPNNIAPSLTPQSVSPALTPQNGATAITPRTTTAPAVNSAPAATAPAGAGAQGGTGGRK